MAKQTTQERKIAALRALYDKVGKCQLPEWTSERVAEAIREMAPAIRSELWRASVESYAQFVEHEAEEDERLTNWAYFQGSVYFGSAVL